MTTSGITSFEQTRDQISTDTLTLLGIYGTGDTPSTVDLSFCANILEKMVKGWEGQGIHLWTATEATLFLTLGQQKYSLASTATDVIGDYTIFNTLTNAGVGSSIVVTSTVGIKVNDNIGVVRDAGTIQWTTVSSVNVDGVTLGLNAPISGSASAGNQVFSFTNRTDRPLMLTSVRFRSLGGYERPIEIMGRTDYMNISSKTSTGPVNQVFFAPKVSDAWLYTWPCCDTIGEVLNVSYIRRIQDFNSANFNADIPQEWLETITYNLAVRIAPAYGISTQKLNPDISAIAQSSLAQMQLFDGELGSLRVNPNYDWE